MKTYKELVLEAMNGRVPDEKTMRIIDTTDCYVEKSRRPHPQMAESFLLQISGAITNWHFTEDSARVVIDKMKPVVLLHDGEKVDMDIFNYMKMEGLSAMAVMDAVRSAYGRAKAVAERYGINAPIVPEHYNEWDMYVTMAMYYADYWMEASVEKGADFVYMYLSDIDYPKDKNKIWCYLIG